ncbi:hypothetical protein [Microvirga thermotolerans]|uniref:Uncharacterized protein n=1 Tax=Microvirga thermotolerans TaxID=2651334 RepID=A0A5P9JRR3_9HYPH|nr:hypothetical protein [Microvirga thermotolerans]QFU14791.1 hypothetical protein GDR74_00385 [Microvirga thermotolerans]
MSVQETHTGTPQSHAELGDETFMSAAELRKYMTDVQMARASNDLDSMDRAGKARKDLVKTLSEPIDLSRERLQAITQSLLQKLRTAAQRGETELMAMRFPVDLCSDRGRAINNSEPSWPETLTGRPRQAYELWRDHLKDAGYRLKATIVEWPGGLPGDVGLFLVWGETKQ